MKISIPESILPFDSSRLSKRIAVSKIFRRLSQVFLLITLTAVFSPAAQAEALVMIQGYLSKGGSWRDSGITQALQRHGWLDGGQLAARYGQVRTSLPDAKGTRRFYTLALHSDAPLAVQVQELASYLDFVRDRHPGESLLLVGHSAGGVLGRLYMVQHPEAGVSTLISIASPHLGTESAELGLDAGRSPLGFFSRFLGPNDTLNRSQGLYHDLIRERPGSLLYWLNHQPHPPARYISIVRSNDLSWVGDLVVPEWSQDLNQVYALRGRAQTIPTSGGHALEVEDGQRLVRILERLRGS